MPDVALELINSRSDTLTVFFKLFPILASDHFYILVIAMGAWLRIRPPLFWELGFLVPFSTLFNCTLKNYFTIPRPDPSLYLVPVPDPFGFPSGDVQVAMVFWGMLCCTFRFLWITLGAACILFLMMLSRLYFGVHSLADVMGGALIGIGTLLIYKSSTVQVWVNQWFQGKIQSYGLVVFGALLFYFLASLHESSPPVVIAASGALIGYGISLCWHKKTHRLPNTRPNLISLVLSVGILIMTAFAFPVWTYEPTWFWWVMGVIKYAFLVFLIYGLLPQFQQWVSDRI